MDGSQGLPSSRQLSTIERMSCSFVAEDGHVDEVRAYFDDYVGLEHVRIQKSDDMLVLESGPESDVITHIRLRRIGEERWQIEMPTKTGGWDCLPLCSQLNEALDIVIAEFPSLLAPKR
jgi:hypothetical protein